jgi:hypothetical protein
MRFDIEDVYFPPAVRDKIYARGIDEDMVLRALAAGANAHDGELRITGEWVDTGHPDVWALAQDPASGRYLEIGFVLEQGNVARCYHAMNMRERDRRRFRGRG